MHRMYGTAGDGVAKGGIDHLLFLDRGYAGESSTGHCNVGVVTFQVRLHLRARNRRHDRIYDVLFKHMRSSPGSADRLRPQKAASVKQMAGGA